jgi:hypothetical protein
MNSGKLVEDGGTLVDHSIKTLCLQQLNFTGMQLKVG